MARPRREQQVQDLPDDLGLCDPADIIDISTVRAARAGLPDAQRTHGIADLFAALADPTRVRVIAALAHGDLCVSDLAATVGLSTSAVSHQLRVLRDIGLVAGEREGRHVRYRLDDDHVVTLYQQAAEHVAHVDNTANVAHARTAGAK